MSPKQLDARPPAWQSIKERELPIFIIFHTVVWILLSARDYWTSHLTNRLTSGRLPINSRPHVVSSLRIIVRSMVDCQESNHVFIHEKDGTYISVVEIPTGDQRHLTKMSRRILR